MMPADRLAGIKCAKPDVATIRRASIGSTMSDTVISPSFPAFGRNRMMVALLAIGIANALVRPAVESLDEWGLFIALSGGLGSGWPVYLGLLGAVVLGLRSTAERPVDRWDGLAVLLYIPSLLVPSSGFSAISLMIFGAWELARRPRDVHYRASLVIFIAAGARELWVATAMKMLSPWLLHIDAVMAHTVLDLLGHGTTVNGNLILTDTGMVLAVLMTCSSFANISLALLTWLVLTRWLRPHFRRRDLVSALLVTLSVIVINLTRLTIMGLGPFDYAVAHGQIGQTSTEVAILIATLAVTHWGLSNGSKARAAGVRSGPAAGGKSRG
jgi:exosortase/archaeosortase